jgi:hypothetical protein
MAPECQPSGPRYAIASLVDANGRILVKGLMPPPISAAVREALSDIELGRDSSAPEVDVDWGEPGLGDTASEVIARRKRESAANSA